MHKKYLAAGAFTAGLAVALGAFGAHGLQKLTSDEKILHGFQTGVQYQFYHALALLLLGIMRAHMPVKSLRGPATFFIAGIILFSGSLYLLTWLKLQESGAVKFVGPLTPLGGVCFIAGWLLLLVAVLSKKNS